MTKATPVEPIERATNRTWDEWLAFMDSIGARELSHGQIAGRVLEELDGVIDSAGWWAQGVTVAYEQHIGRRIPGQSVDGTFQTSASKVTPFDMRELMDRWTTFAAADREVLDLIAGDVRISGTEKRLNWRVKGKDGTAIMVSSVPKADGRASLVAQQTGLASHELNVAAKERWQGVLGRFLAGE